MIDVEALDRGVCLAGANGLHGGGIVGDAIHVDRAVAYVAVEEADVDRTVRLDDVAVGAEQGHVNGNGVLNDLAVLLHNTRNSIEYVLSVHPIRTDGCALGNNTLTGSYLDRNVAHVSVALECRRAHVGLYRVGLELSNRLTVFGDKFIDNRCFVLGRSLLDSLILGRLVGRGLLVGCSLVLSGLLGCGLVLGGLGRLIGRLVGRRLLGRSLLGGLLLGGRGLLGLDLDLQTVGHRLGGNGVDAGRVGRKLGLGSVGRDLLDRLYGKAALGGDAKLELLIGRGLHGFVGGGVGVRPNGKCALGEREGNGCGGVRRGRYRRLAILRSALPRYVF